MKMNVFEGARRISYVVCVLIVASSAIVGWFVNSGLQSMMYFIPLPGVEQERQVSFDGSHICPPTTHMYFDTRKTPNGRFVNLELCFPTMPSDSGVEFLPTKLIDKQMQGWELNTPGAMDYMRTTSGAFRVPPDDLAEVDRRYPWFIARHIGYATAIGIGIAVVFLLVVHVVGWIVRGFLGVPRGQDHIA